MCKIIVIQIIWIFDIFPLHKLKFNGTFDAKHQMYFRIENLTPNTRYSLYLTPGTGSSTDRSEDYIFKTDLPRPNRVEILMANPISSSEIVSILIF